MATTAVLNEDTATIVTDDSATRRFSWSAAFAGAFVATAVTLLLLTLGSGVGLSLVTVRHATASGAVTFLTLGAIYFLAAQAFGFAAGGHVVGRLIGPAPETDREEEFRAGTHGLVSWALAVVATATLIALATVVGGSATANGALSGALAATVPSSTHAEASPVTAYWVDTLFRAPTATQAMLGWRQYAQVQNGSATDGTTAPTDSTIPPDASTTVAPPATATVTPPAETPARHPSDTVYVDPNTAATATPAVAGVPAQPPRSVVADKAEAGRILTVGMANGGQLSSDDHTQLARLVEQDTGLTLGAAQSRVTDVVSRIHNDEIKAAETTRKTAAYAALWWAFALLFGAMIAVAAAISARWEDDKERGILPGTRVSDVRL